MSDLALSLPAAAPVRRRRAPPRSRAAPLAWALLLPSGAFLVMFTYWPVAQVLWRSLIQQRYGAAWSWGLGNYVRLFADARFARAVGNTALYALGTILPSILLALLFALALREGGRLNALLRTLLVLPMMVPLVAAAALFTFLFLPGEGLLDYYLAKLGVGATNWLGDPSLALGALVGLTVWKNAGYYMLFFLAGLAGVPEELHEAAWLEGAGAWQRFRNVTLPLLGPTFAFVAVIALVAVLTQVDHVVVMTGGGPSDATLMLLFYIYQVAHQNGDVGLASAATCVSVTGLFALSVLSLRALEAGIHYES